MRPDVQWPSSPFDGFNSMPLTFNSQSSSSICAKLVTINKNGRKEAVVLGINKPVTIGRNPGLCSYVIHDNVVSNVHCKLYAVRSCTGGIIVSCQVLSMNGLILNGQRIRKAPVILMDGDIVEIPSSQTFECVHIWKDQNEKNHIFDPTPPRQPSHKRIGPYTVTSHCLGSGSFGTVFLAVDTSVHRQVACKSIKLKKDSEVGKVLKEVRILMALNHPNINRIYHVEIDGKFVHIFLELCTGGDLFTYIVDHTRLCEGEAKYIMYQLLKALMYLHNKMISHRGIYAKVIIFILHYVSGWFISDLKPENILLYCPGPYPRIEIADFGLARPKAYQETFNVCGTVSYLPPEGILALDNVSLGYVGMPADCWSAGVIMFIMLSVTRDIVSMFVDDRGFHPFDQDPMASLSQAHGFSDLNSQDFANSQNSIKSENKVKKRILSGNMSFPTGIWDEMLDAKGLVGRLLTPSHLHRATVYSALHSQWIAKDQTDLENAYQERVVSD